ncbi:MAG: hypothetical protein VB051_09425 [Candidatus Pelethousia sp.]|nr:hypothetical protein [Candidatus Pelethousia sp.]
MKLCRFAPEKSTLPAFAAGIAAVLLSLAVALFNGAPAETAMHIFLQDFLMIYLLGFCFPLAYVQRRGPGRYAALGITKRKPGLSRGVGPLSL